MEVGHVRQKKWTWVVLNQSLPPAFQHMLEALADEFGPCLLLTGTPHPMRSSGSNLTVLKGPSYERTSLAQRAKSWLAFTAWAGSIVATLRGNPLILAVTNPPMMPHLAWALSGIRRFPYEVLVWDIYPDHMVKMGWIREGGLSHRSWRALNQRTLTKSRAVITLGEGMAEALQCQMNSMSPAVDVIPNWVDTDVLRPLDKATNPFAVEHGQVDKVTVMYSGNMGGSHAMGAIAEAAAMLHHRADIHFMLIGDGLGRVDIERGMNRYRLRNVSLLPMQSWDVVPQSIATADIGIVTQAPGTEHLSVPSKTYSLLAVGAAVLAITEPHSDLARLVEAHDVGVSCNSRGRAIADAIVTLVDDPERLRRVKLRAREIAEQHYDERVVFQAFRRVVAQGFERSPQ